MLRGSTSASHPWEYPCIHHLSFYRDAIRIWITKSSSSLIWRPRFKPCLHAKPWICTWSNLLFCSWHWPPCFFTWLERWTQSYFTTIKHGEIVNSFSILTEIKIWSTDFTRGLFHLKLIRCFLNSVSQREEAACTSISIWSVKLQGQVGTLGGADAPTTSIGRLL